MKCFMGNVFKMHIHSYPSPTHIPPHTHTHIPPHTHTHPFPHPSPHTLVLNSNMRRIDLCCKLMAPAITGIVLQWMGPFATTLFVASWNVISFFAELSLIRVVYQLIPPLAKKKTRKRLPTVAEEALEEEVRSVFVN